MVRVTAVQAVADHKIKVTLSNNKEGLFDVSPYLDKGIFRELRDPEYFALVRLAFGGVAWPHEQDFSAETIEFELQVDQATSLSFRR